MNKNRVHLSEFDEFLADSFLEYGSSFEIEIKEHSPEGFITIQTSASEREFKQDSIDFDLSGSECSGLFESEFSDLLNRSIYTGSPREFVEFLFPALSSLTLLIDIVEGSWRLDILSYQYMQSDKD